MARAAQVVSTLGVAVRNENIRRVELAWGAAIAAEWAHFVALGVYAYDHGGASAVGVAGLVRLLPAAIVAPFAAWFGDRYRRERFLLAMTLIGSAALAGSAAAFFAGGYVLVLAFAGLVGVASTLFRPALQALLPSLARTPEELIAANGATSTIESLATLIGPLVAGAVVALADAGVAFVVASVAFLVAAMLLARVSVGSRIDLSAGVEAGDARRMLSAGLRSISEAPGAPLLVGLVVAQTFVRGCLNVLIVVAAFDVFDAGAGAVGYMTAAIGVGGVIGAVGAMTLEGRRLAVPFGLALVAWGVPLILIAPRPELAAAIVLLAIVGAANSVEDVAVFTLLQRTIPDEILTRVLALVWGLAMGGVALGSLAAPAIVDAIGARAAFAVVGAILPLLTLVAYRRLVLIDRALTPVPELGLIERVPMFAPLPLATKERVAANLVPLSVGAGELVIRAGDTGDRFYIVRDGEFDIDADGQHSTARQADYFGEIALLRDVPRTATVTAVVDSELLALHRDAFLAAVTGHSAAHVAGEAVADARLARQPAGGPRRSGSAVAPSATVDTSRIAAFPILAELPPAELDELAAAMSELEVEAGAQVITLDDYGTAVYFIEQGEADVLADSGETTEKVGPGDPVGEISLLLTGQRTATVVARTAMQLLSLSGQDFDGMRARVPELERTLRRLGLERAAR